MKKKLALKLTIELWKKLANSKSKDYATKQGIYKDIKMREFGVDTLTSSSCFLCDKYYKKQGVSDNSCHKCPLYIAGYGCDNIRNSEKNLYHKWWIAVDKTQPTLDLLNVLKQLKKKSK